MEGQEAQDAGRRIGRLEQKSDSRQTEHSSSTCSTVAVVGLEGSGQQVRIKQGQSPGAVACTRPMTLGGKDG